MLQQVGSARVANGDEAKRRGYCRRCAWSRNRAAGSAADPGDQAVEDGVGDEAPDVPAVRRHLLHQAAGHVLEAGSPGRNTVSRPLRCRFIRAIGSS